MRAANIIKTASPPMTMPTIALTESVEPLRLVLVIGVTVAVAEDVGEDVGEVVVDPPGAISAGKYWPGANEVLEFNA